MKRFFYVLIFSLSFTTTFSQSREAEPYHYLFAEFTQGIILMKNGTKNPFLLNYNSLTEEMILNVKGNMIAIEMPELDLVDTVTIEDRKFFRMNNTFVELIHHSLFDLYAEHKCSMVLPGKPTLYGGTSQTSAATSIKTINSGGRLYDLKLPDDFQIKPYTEYWLKKKKGQTKFINMKQLMDLYTDQKDAMKAYVKAHDVKYDNPESIVQCITYMESLAKN